MLHLRYGGDVDVRHVLGTRRRRARRLRAPRRHRPGRRVQRRAGRRPGAPRRQGVGHGLVAAPARREPRRAAAAVGARRAARRRAAGRLARLRAASATLWQMRRSLYAAAAGPGRAARPASRLRSFLPGARRRRVGGAQRARRSSTSPTRAAGRCDDLHAADAEPWFDPAGLPRRRGGRAPGGERMVGFHWTKVHGADARPARATTTAASGPRRTHEPTHDHDGHGASTATATSRSARCTSSASTRRSSGRGLGRALTLAGLQHLRSRGLPDAMLYVDADNTSAIALYDEPRLHPLGHRRRVHAAADRPPTGRLRSGPPRVRGRRMESRTVDATARRRPGRRRPGAPRPSRRTAAARRPVPRPRAVLAGVQRAGARARRGPRPAAARARQVPGDLRQQPRRVLHGARRRPQAAHRHRHRRARGQRARCPREVLEGIYAAHRELHAAPGRRCFHGEVQPGAAEARASTSSAGTSLATPSATSSAELLPTTRSSRC